MERYLKVPIVTPYIKADKGDKVKVLDTSRSPAIRVEFNGVMFYVGEHEISEQVVEKDAIDLTSPKKRTVKR